MHFDSAPNARAAELILARTSSNIAINNAFMFSKVLVSFSVILIVNGDCAVLIVNI